MALSFVNVSAVAPAGSTTTTWTQTVPAGTANGDLMLWTMVSNIVTQPATPAGWSVWQTVITAGSGSGHTIFFRVASSEPASYAPTVTSGKWAGVLAVYRGQDPTTQKDAANVTLTATAGTINAPAITTVTANAFVVASEGQNTASAVTTTAFTDSAGNLRASVTQTSAAAQNIAAGHSDMPKVAAGSTDPNLTFAPTGGVRATAVTSAIRPAPGGAPAAIPRRPLVQLAAVGRAVL